MTRPAEVYTQDEVARLVRACSRRSLTGPRNRALIVLLFQVGLRISEALALREKDIDVTRGVLTVLHGKGDRQRTLGVDVGTLAELHQWLAWRAARGIRDPAPVFCTKTGQPWAPSAVRALLPKLARRAGITKRVHPHGLRHSFAFGLAMRGVPVHVIQAAMGHASLQTTDTYLRHVAPAAVIQTMQATKWEG